MAVRLNSGVRPYQGEKKVYYIALALLVLGFVLLALGYRKNNRNMLVAAALALLAAGGLPGFVAGYQDGYKGAERASAVSAD